ncbi:MAG: orotate phosphoribosyltransferase [Candidatus Omnitrophica bacterium]|nr:orotate phosphoribosyltransferase [Candidatus Omnitrophota bacterium]
MKNRKILKIFKKTNALLKGHFKLSSGLHSEGYFQCALLLQHPKYAKMFCRSLANKFRRLRPAVVAGPAIGGIIVSYEVANALGCRSIFMERENDIMTLRRGFDIKKGERVLIVEDVITTGGSTREVMEVVRKKGGRVAGIGSIVDRSCGELDFGVEFISLIKININTYKQEECPLCKKGIQLVKPGSRKI